jgi:hypothetical protein
LAAFAKNKNSRLSMRHFGKNHKCCKGENSATALPRLKTDYCEVLFNQTDRCFDFSGAGCVKEYFSLRQIELLGIFPASANTIGNEF